MGDKMNKNTQNFIYQYLKWRGDLTFEQDAFNEIDAFIFTQLSYYDFSGLVYNDKVELKTVLKKFYEHNKQGYKLGLILPEHIGEVGKILIKTKRYEHVCVSHFIDKYDKFKKEQFTGLTFHLNDEKIIITYRGTDDTLIGWEENFNMIVSFPVQAQLSAKEYMNMITQSYPNAYYYLCGHSKGGNLAMYAGIYSTPAVQSKIAKIYNFDGPGFEIDDIEFEKYLPIKNKIRTIIPTNSIIGMIFQPLGIVKPVKSSVKPVFQHDGFMWEIDANCFSRGTLSKNSVKFSQELNALVSSMKESDRMSFCNSLEKYIDSLGIKTLTELLSLKTKPIGALKVFTKQDREIFFKFVKILVKYSVI